VKGAMLIILIQVDGVKGKLIIPHHNLRHH